MFGTRVIGALVALLLLAAPAWAQTRQVLDDGNNVVPGALRQGTTNFYVLSTTSNLGRPFQPGTKVIDIVCTVACNVSQSSSPATATSASFLLPANTIRRLKVNGTTVGGNVDSIAVIGAATGTFFIVEMN